MTLPKASYSSAGASIDHTPGSALSAGDVVVIGTDLVCIVKTDLEASRLGSVSTEGIFRGCVDAAAGFGAGEDVYWDADGTPEVDTYGAALSGCFTDDPALGIWCGKAIEAAAASGEHNGTVLFQLNSGRSTGLLAVETVAATRALTAAESGKVIVLNHATEFVTTLPAAAPGLNFMFIVGAAPSSASYTVVTAASANVIVGQVLTNDFSGTTDSDFEASGGDTITFVDAKAVKGDWVRLVCDGTNWFMTGACSVFDGITISTAT